MFRYILDGNSVTVPSPYLSGVQLALPFFKQGRQHALPLTPAAPLDPLDLDPDLSLGVEPEPDCAAPPGCRCHIFHGVEDSVVPVTTSKALLAWLTQVGQVGGAAFFSGHVSPILRLEYCIN